MSRRSTSISLDSSTFSAFLGTFTELLRSLGLSLAASKLMTFIAILIIVSSSIDTVRDILLAREEIVPDLFNLPQTFLVILIVVLIICSIVTILGIYGYARLDRDFMTFYGIVMIMMISWYIMFSLILATQSEEQDAILLDLYGNYSKNDVSKSAVGAVQRKFQCCRSKSFKYKIEPTKFGAYLPGSCCSPQNTSYIPLLNLNMPYCHYKQAYRKICPTNKTTLGSSLRDADMYQVVYQAGAACAAFTSLEVSVVFVMMHRMNVYLREQGFVI